MHMHRNILLAAALFVVPACGEVEDGFAPLFNGTDLTGWRVVNGQADFTVENGELVGRGENLGQNSFLRTERTFGDFDFRFEMKFDDLTGNSGVMFRAEQRDGGTGRVFGYQCEHCNNKDRAWTAGIFDEARRGWLVPYRDDRNKGYSDEEKAAHEAARQAFSEQIKRLMKWDDWNEIRILAQGRRIQIWLNGEQTVYFTDDGEEFTPEGFFGLQVHSGKSCNVRWRNLRIKEL